MYKELIEAHEGLSKEQSHELNAKLMKSMIKASGKMRSHLLEMILYSALITYLRSALSCTNL